MIQQFFQWLQALGIPGLFLVMFLEGSSLPFPGLIIVLSYGYALSPGYVNTAFIAVGMSVFYTLSSLIPYFLGMKLEGYFPKRLAKGLKRGQLFFNKYGVWTIAFSRPFGIGNYISYVAGISRVSLLKYLILTFLGIYPWSYIMILLGDYLKGNYEAFQHYFYSYSNYGYVAGAIGVIVFIIFYFQKKKRQKAKLEKEGRTVETNRSVTGRWFS